MKWERLITAAVAVFALGAATNAANAQYLKGKTVTLLFGYSPGGTANAQASVLAPFLTRHTPGNPKVVVKSMPGAGGLKAQNFLFEKAKPNGLTILWTPVAIQEQVLGRPGARFDYGKWKILGAFTGSTLMTYARIDAVPGGLKRAEDIVKAKGTLVQPALRGSGWYDMLTRAGLELLGMKTRFVPGYRGGAKVAAAMRAGEGQITGAATTGFVKRVAPNVKGTALGLWYYPNLDDNGNFIRDPVAENIGIRSHSTRLFS